MNAVEFIKESVQGLHKTLIDDMQPLTQELVTWRPQPGANPIGAIFMHCIMTEDAYIRRIQGLPSIWESENWEEKSGIAPPNHRISPEDEEADRVASLPLVESLVYARRVMENTHEFLDTLDDGKLDIIPDPEMPRRTIAVNFSAFVLSHGWWHLGEIKYLKGLQGDARAGLADVYNHSSPSSKRGRSTCPAGRCQCLWRSRYSS
jgi:hypothetical protein